MRPFFGLSLALLVALATGLSSCGPQPKQVEQRPSAPPASGPIAIPQVADASANWGAQAHQVQVLTPVGADVTTKASLDVAWTADALLLHVHTDDAAPDESSKAPWENDSVEIFLASSFGSDDRIQFICTPGRATDPPHPVSHVNDKRSGAPALIEPSLQTVKEGDGYAMTLAIPWANLKHVPHAGDVIGLQVYVNDSQTGGRMTHRVWYPSHDTSNDPTQMQRVQLADHASPPEDAAAWLTPRGFEETLHVAASAQEQGKSVELWLDGQKIASASLESGGRYGSTLTVPLPDKATARKGEPMVVTLDGQTLPGGLTMPDLEKQRFALIKDVPLATHTIFSGDAFPTIDFQNRELVEAAIGPYALHARFFDNEWNEVTAPKAPGRYGALVEFKSADGLTFTQHLNFFKTPHPYEWTKESYGGTLKFPPAFGVPDDEAARQQWIINNAMANTLSWSERTGDTMAGLLCALQDLQKDPARWHGFNASSIDNAWWSELQKRQGESQDYKYLSALPEGYDKDKKAWPLILFLHGSGERGDDLSKLKNQGPIGYINKGHPLPFVVIEPQCPEDERWDCVRLARLLDTVEAAFRIDPKRIYVTGLSLGGYASFDFGATYPDRIAAIAPQSGGETPALAERLKKMPTWIFHGAEDDVVPVRYSIDLAHAMQKLGAPVKLTIYPGVGHGGWDVTYSDPSLYAWFLQQSK